VSGELAMNPWMLGQAAVIALLILLLFWQQIRQRHVNRDALFVLSKQLEQTNQQLAAAQSETEELRAGIIGVGQRVLTLDQRVLTLENQLQQLHSAFSELAEQQQALSLTDPESKIYTRAMKMVQLGADLEEIMRECELPRAEAELLFNLHQAKS
jgi:septal ring factor EnvC (AmiA/AmiB activator)